MNERKIYNNTIYVIIFRRKNKRGNNDTLDSDNDWCKIDGEAITKVEDISKFKALKLLECKV